MKVVMVDGKAIFPSYLVRADQKYYCYFDHELERIEGDLNSKEIKYTVETLEKPEIDPSIRFGSRSEIIDYLEKGIEPDNVDNFKRRLKETKEKIAVLEQKSMSLEMLVQEVQTLKTEMESIRKT